MSALITPEKALPLAIPARDGYRLAATRYAPRGPSDRVILITPAIGVARRFYAPFARFLAERGSLVVTFDYRGIGDSRPARLGGFPATLSSWGECDIAGVIDWTASHHPTRRLMVIGHSAGGQLLGLAANVARLSAVMTVASQSGYWRHWPRPSRYLMASLWYGLVPALTAVFHYFPARALGLGEDLPAGVSREWSRWCRHPSYATDPSGRILDGHYTRYAGPLLSLSFDDDLMAPRGAVDWLAERYQSAALTRRHIHPSEAGLAALGHFGFFRPACRSTLWPHAAEWLEKQ